MVARRKAAPDGKHKPGLDDLIGLGHTKLGFFREVQDKIVELRKSNQELEARRQEVQAILDGISDVVAVIAADYKVRSVNNSFYDLFPDKAPVGARCYELFRKRDTPCETCVHRQALKSNQVCRESAIIRIEGRNRQFDITASPLRDADGRPTDIILVKRDVTLEKKFQAQYQHAEKMATIGLLAAGVAHEINNPLASIQGFAEGLRRRMGPISDSIEDPVLRGDVEEYVGIILKECRRCSDIVRSLLTFSPRKEAVFSKIALNPLVENVLRILYHRLKSCPQCILERDLDPYLLEIQGNPAELEQVILNLVLNAMDAVDGRGTIRIRTRFEDQHHIALEVEDDGCGISPEDQTKLFEPFFTTKPVGEGVGIGLSTCYHIIKAHSGEIRVRSAPGRGACFTVTLPWANNGEKAL
jgi:two-component system, NtrC family, sensor kinase